MPFKFTFDPQSFAMETLGWPATAKWALLSLRAHYVQTGKPIINNDALIAHVTGLTLVELAAVKNLLLSVFVRRGNELLCKHCEIAVLNRKFILDTASKAGKKSAAKKAEQKQSLVNDRSTTVEQAVEKLDNNLKQHNTTKKGCRIHEWADELPPHLIQWTENLGFFAWQKVWDNFYNYWRNDPSGNAVKINWDTTWKNWLKKAMENERNGFKQANKRRIVTSHDVLGQAARELVNEINGLGRHDRPVQPATVKSAGRARDQDRGTAPLFEGI